MLSFIAIICKYKNMKIVNKSVSKCFEYFVIITTFLWNRSEERVSDYILSDSIGLEFIWFVKVGFTKKSG